MASCPSHGKLSKARILVQVKLLFVQLAQGKVLLVQARCYWSRQGATDPGKVLLIQARCYWSRQDATGNHCDGRKWGHRQGQWNGFAQRDAERCRGVHGVLAGWPTTIACWEPACGISVAPCYIEGFLGPRWMRRVVLSWCYIQGLLTRHINVIRHSIWMHTDIKLHSALNNPRI